MIFPPLISDNLGANLNVVNKCMHVDVVVVAILYAADYFSKKAFYEAGITFPNSLVKISSQWNG